MEENPKKPSDKRLVYTDEATVVKLAREKGFSDEQIVLELTRGSDYQECLAIARRYAPILGIKVSEFMVIAHRRRR
jgi:hypothetical protein